MFGVCACQYYQTNYEISANSQEYFFIKLKFDPLEAV